MESKWIRLILGVVVSFVLCFVSTGSARSQAPGNQGWEAESPYGMLYDPTYELYVVGRITGVLGVVPTRGSTPIVGILIRTPEGLMVPVDLGPEWFLLSKGVRLREGESVRVLGSKVQMGYESVIIAAEIERGDRKVVLRDNIGFPVWGWGG